MKRPEKRAVLVIGHGSRREEANDEVRQAAAKIQEIGGFDFVEAAFLEISAPTIAEGFAKLVRRGARHITVHPYFLMPGRHTRGDIPVKVAEAAKNHFGVSYKITEPLNSHPLVVEACVERICAAEHWEKSNKTLFTEQAGKVYITGAGCGDVGLLTLKARDLLATCDTVVYDYLVNPEILDFAPIQAEKIYVGKIGGGKQTAQEEINRLLIEKAAQNKKVVRLKGGDPFIYGRGGEEALALREAGIEFEIIPGISSATAVAAYAGIPLTHRNVSSSVAILTGTQIRDEKPLADAAGAETLVILMGLARLRELARELISAGRSPLTPVAVIGSGTYAGQQTVVGILHNIADETAKAGTCAPAVIIVGEVVRLRERLQWFEQTLTNQQAVNIEILAA